MATEHFHTDFSIPMRIIAENDAFIVVALRIDKSVIAQNLPFLAALASTAPPAAAVTIAAPGKRLA